MGEGAPRGALPLVDRATERGVGRLLLFCQVVSGGNRPAMTAQAGAPQAVKGRLTLTGASCAPILFLVQPARRAGANALLTNQLAPTEDERESRLAGFGLKP
jgi:hypothetical protein